MKRLISCIILLFSIACEKNIEPVSPGIYSVPAEIQPYIEAFKKEAALRNIPINLDNLIVSFEGPFKKNVCGLCEQVEDDANYQRTVNINRNDLCWTSESIQNREALIFHELGHCVLGRYSHKDDLLPNKSPASIMSSTLSGQYEPCKYAISGNSNDCNKTSRRKYYMDELFNAKTAVPDWGKK